MNARRRTSLRAAARDTALRRLSWFRRGLAAGAVLLLIVLANASARAFSGHATTSSRARAVSPGRQSTTASGAASRRRGTDHAASARGAAAPVSPPATVPKLIAAPGSTATPATTTAPAATVPAAPAPVQVVSGGS